MTLRIWPGNPAPTGTSAGAQNSYTLGTEFSLSAASALQNIWWYSPAGASVLPDAAGVWDISGLALVTYDAAPLWLAPGGAPASPGSGWVYCDFTGAAVTLATGVHYVVSVYQSSAGVAWWVTQAGYWTAASGLAGQSGITNGALSAPNTGSSVNGQGCYDTTGTWEFPGTDPGNGEVFYVDVEVAGSGGPATATATGAGSVTANSSRSGTATVAGAGSVTANSGAAPNSPITVAGSEWTASGGAQLTVTVSPVTVGDLMVLGFFTSGASSQASAVTGGGVTTWQQASSYYDTASQVDVEFWYGTVTATGSATVTVTDTSIGTNWGKLWCREFTATGAVWTVVSASQAAGASGAGLASGTSVAYPSLTPSAGGNNLYAGGCYSVYGQMAAGSTSGFSYETPADPAEQIVYSTSVSAAVAPAATQNNTGAYDAIGVLFSAGTGSSAAPGAATTTGAGAVTGFARQSAVTAVTGAGAVTGVGTVLGLSTGIAAGAGAVTAVATVRASASAAGAGAVTAVSVSAAHASVTGAGVLGLVLVTVAAGAAPAGAGATTAVVAGLATGTALVSGAGATGPVPVTQVTKAAALGAGAVTGLAVQAAATGAALTTQVVPHTGQSVVWVNTGSGGLAQNGNTTPCGPGLGLLVKNDGATMNVRITVPAALTFDGLVIADRVVTVTSTFMALIPMVAGTYMDPATSLATFGFSATPTSVSVACIYISV